MSDSSGRVTKKMYCSSCWRDEKHVSRSTSKVAVIVLSIVTLGIFYFIQPFKCKVCGTERMRGFGE